jgi:hypothetical protein
MVRRAVTSAPFARAQIEKELNLIEKLNLAGYFLIVWDIICFCNGESWSRAGVPRPAAQSATRLASRQSIRSAWGCSLSDS